MFLIQDWPLPPPGAIDVASGKACMMAGKLDVK
jgi:hypothetical protein